MNRNKTSALLAAPALLAAVVVADRLPTHPDRLVVHEWGTFTSLQDEEGQALPILYGEDEPLPDFVHGVGSGGCGRPAVADASDPLITVRLETPVIYFYPASSEDSLRLDVEVDFPGGWLNQFYPDAETEAPGIEEGILAPETVGRLAWRGLQIGGEANGPFTTSRVWTAPRAVEAASVTTSGGESERYLFYRGLGRFESPLRVRRDAPGSRLLVDPQGDGPSDLVIPALWLVEVRRDGRSGFMTFGPLPLGDGQGLADLPARFDEDSLSMGNFTALRGSMHTALVESGLYPAEADAMLNTWETSYFRSPGLRLFFVLPRAWTDQRLPLRLSVPEDRRELERVMIGRLELVTLEQRQLVHRVTDEGLARAERWGAYQNLGRFRDAILLDEISRGSWEPPHDAIWNGLGPRVKCGASR
jgi:hypothetical protein